MRASSGAATRRGPGAIFLLLAIFASAAAAAPGDLETRVDATEVSLGQSVTLTLHLRGALLSSEPDLTPLQGAFEVLDVGRSERTTIVNGAYDASSDWTITLLPQRTGTLEIPALAVGSEHSAPRSITVLASSGVAAGPRDEDAPDAAPVFVRVLAERPDPYEQERVLLHARLYAGPEVLEGAMSDLHIDGATVERLGEDRPFREEVAGLPYRGIERTYAVLPEAPGKLDVPPVRFEGLVRDERPPPRRRRFGAFGPSLIDEFFSNGGLGGDFFDRFLDRGSRRVVVRSEALTLDVRPRPEASADAWWLPARAVSLAETWKPDPHQVSVGQALTRRITLRAEGAGASQLPELAAPEREGVKQYAEAPQVRENEAGSVRVQEITVIPTRAGRLELPPVEVAWWDTAADAPRVASLDARAIEVLPGAAGETPTAAREALPAPEAAAANAGAEPAPAAAGARPPIPRPLLWAAGIALLGLLAAAASRSWGRGAARAPGAGPTLRAAERSLRRACRRSDPAAAERALHQVVRARAGAARIDALPWARGLGGEDLAREVARLRSVRYSTRREEWQGEQLWRAYRSTRKWRRNSGREPRGGLPPLYPTPGSEGGARGAG